MFRQALSEVRLHPGRFISTLLAIAISVAFLAGSAVLVATESQAQGKAMNVSLASADLVVTMPKDGSVPGVAKVLAANPQVIASSALLTTSEVVANGALSQAVQLVNLPPEQLRWARLVAGTWPAAADEVTLSRAAAGAMDLTVGGILRPAGGETQLRVVGLTDEPSGMFSKTGYAALSLFAAQGLTPDLAPAWSVKAAPGTDLTALATSLRSELAQLNPAIKVDTAEHSRSVAVARLAGDFQVFSNVLWAFGAVSLVVGMITIANTFSITLAQRRRQIGLLRAVGASGAQVRRRFLIEAALLGVIGSAIGLLLGTGLATAATAWSSALFWGLSLPWSQLAIAAGLGILATVVAAFVPIVRGTRVLPLEALQPALGATEHRQWSIWRAVICGLLVAGGLATAAYAVSLDDNNAMLFAIGAGGLIAAGVLFGGPLFVPTLLKGIGGLFRWTGPVARLAANNAERNPRRATATATALMLAVGLMVTLQVATASLRVTVLDEIAVHYPVDVAISWGANTGKVEQIPPTTATKLAAIPGVDNSVLLSATSGDVGDQQGMIVLGYDPRIAAVTGVDQSVSDDSVLVSESIAKEFGSSVVVKTSHGKLPLKVRPSRLTSFNEVMVSPATLAKLGTPTAAAVMWLSIPNRAQALPAMAAAADIVGSQDRISGSLAEAALYEQVLNVLLAITTALLAVAVLIALIGVSNTLGLSVLERTRESALLRALGLQARSLRAMLTIEALQVTIAGVLVGVLAGAFFGWLAVVSATRAGGFEQVKFAVDVPQTLGMVALAMLAAAAASILPGRRAAKAVPTEALAEV